MTKKFKAFKRCSNCSLFLKKLCKGNENDKFCEDWFPKLASCGTCLRLRICLSENNKSVSKKFICNEFARNKYPISIEKVQSELEGLEEVSEETGEDMFSPVKLVEDIIKSDFDLKAFSQVDERSFPQPKNDIEFIMDPEFMNIPLFPRQLVVTLNVLNCHCPYCSDIKFVNTRVEVDTPVGEILDRVTLYDAKGLCPECGKTRYDAYKKGKLNLWNQLIGVVGQRGGKSSLTAILSAAIIRKFLALPDYSTFFPGILKGTTLHGTFVSLTFGQAYENLRKPL